MPSKASHWESEAAMPFAGMQQLLRPVMAAVDRLPDRQRQVLLDAFGSTRASPEIFLIALATLNLLSDLAARQSVAVIVDDVTGWDRIARPRGVGPIPVKFSVRKT